MQVWFLIRSILGERVCMPMAVSITGEVCVLPVVVDGWHTGSYDPTMECLKLLTHFLPSRFEHVID